MCSLICLLAAPLAGQRAPARPHWNREPLAANALAPLPLGSIKPEGWLRQQLRVQASGLTGNLDEFWPDLGPHSGWLGGKGESWERGPYYMDGLVPLAFLLEDERLLAKAHKWVGWTLANSRRDGYFGPDPSRGDYKQGWQATDWWPNMVMLKVLTQYQEATGDARVLPLMSAYFNYHLREAADRPLIRWAAHRWADQLLSVVWLYNRTGDAALLRLAKVLHGQSFNWQAHFADFRYPNKIERSQANLSTHVVNNAMALKTPAVWWQVTKEDADRRAVYRMLETLDRHHWQASGVHSGDEHYAGLDPSQGTELCAVVEGMFSLEQMLAILGDAPLADRLERMAYNALPATFKADMWAHQYDQQVNQVLCSIDKSRNWTTNGPDSNIFGLEPNFGCCTANMHQGWPKFVSHLWMATPDGGLAAVAYGPSRVTASLDGVSVTIHAQTEYPFRDTVRLRVETERPTRFPLRLRIPGWAETARLSVNGVAESGLRAGAFHTVSRLWKGGDTVELVFPMKLRAERGYQGAVSILRGPLVFALKMGEDWRKVRGEEPHADWEVHPTTPWNYALSVDPARPEAAFSVQELPLGELVFSPDGAPVRLRARARRLPEWTLLNGSAGPLPASPVKSAAAEEEVILIPYGSAKLRVAAFPWAPPAGRSAPPAKR